MLLTADRRLQFQQNLARFNIGVVVILTVSLNTAASEWRLKKFVVLSRLPSPVNRCKCRFRERVHRRKRGDRRLHQQNDVTTA